MGGQRSEVSAATRTIVLESAYFAPLSVRRTSKALGLKTEASMRFERGADPHMPRVALARALVKKAPLVLLDELNIALKYHYLDVQTVLADLRARPAAQHVVITGRGAPPELIEAADTVTDMTLVKHAFSQGIQAQPGVEL